DLIAGTAPVGAFIAGTDPVGALTAGTDPVGALMAGTEPVPPGLACPDKIASARRRSGLLGASPPGRLGRFGLGAGGGEAPAACACPSLPCAPADRRGGGRRFPQRAHWVASLAFSWAQNGQKRMRRRPIINLAVLEDHASGDDCHCYLGIGCARVKGAIEHG